jgi:hypothetical protein
MDEWMMLFHFELAATFQFMAHFKQRETRRKELIGYMYVRKHHQLTYSVKRSHRN